MTLKSLELSGFKSFGKKSLVSFTTPVTCVVGPNGSGKSNIVESIRFVLGEQSMKSLRGKGGVDLIFKGSKVLSSSSRAGVTITFDNSKKIFSFTNSGLGISLDYDEVSISREVYPDGVNKYSINGTEVRLKDINDLLSSVNIGSSGHHIISQGEADRVLNASNKDRRAMIEDALGLKVYQYRIKESERKLDKTILNMKEVQALRREVAPHLAFLKKQVEKVEKAREMRSELQTFYQTYFSQESAYIQKETARLTHTRRLLDEQVSSLDDRIVAIQSQKEDVHVESVHMQEIHIHEKELALLRTQKDELSRNLGRMEGSLESIERQIAKLSNVTERVIGAQEWKSIVSELEEKINKALEVNDIEAMRDILHTMKGRIATLHTQVNPVQVDESLTHEYKEMKVLCDGIVADIGNLSIKEQGVIEAINVLRAREKEAEMSVRDSERMLYDLLREKQEVASSLHTISFEEEKIGLIKNAFEMELSEGGSLIGREVIDYARMSVETEASRESQTELRRKIERIKIKLEDAGSGNGSEIMKEYTDTAERDVFLGREIEDLGKSIESLRLLIAELKEKLDTEFKTGVGKINTQFQEFFSLMFGGGSAFLSIVMEHKRQKKSDTTIEDVDIEEGDEEESNELGFERGIEINVTLPQKKVKDLHMLSGGERSLTSIALLFAISQVNPPPFLVLDETDAALDEANSRKYGNMLENLSKYSQLIVVTHNRETMSRAQVLYGVTMDASGASKLLSIHLEDANLYAK
jgi:chromosome segregation ATPase